MPPTMTPAAPELLVGCAAVELVLDAAAAEVSVLEGWSALLEGTTLDKSDDVTASVA